MRTKISLPSAALLLSTVAIATVLAAAPMPAIAQQEQKPANEQVIVPQVERREVKLPRFPSNDFEAGVFGGTYATQNFGTSAVGGLRVGYHITEDIFVEAVYAQTRVSDEAFRRVLPGGIFAQEKATLKYYNFSAGLNLLPGEVFFGRNTAKASAAYLIGGVGSTSLNGQRHQTLNLGLGLRLMLKNWAALQVDMRDHIFSLDLLGKRQSTQNLELTGGLTFFF